MKLEYSCDPVRMYTDLAWLWPIISPPEDYIAEALQFASFIRQYGLQEEQLDLPISNTTKILPRSTVLHLGCGGGHLDLTLKKYFDVTGIDLSSEMLVLAQNLNPEVIYQPGDMRSLELGRLFDAVILADSIDYMLTEKELSSVFQVAFAHLKTGGVFITYAEELLEHFENYRTDSSTHIQGDLEVTLIENLYDPDPRDTTYEMIFIYLIRRAGKLTIEVDRHLAGIFPESTWLRLLELAGFRVQQFAAQPDGLRFYIGMKAPA